MAQVLIRLAAQLAVNAFALWAAAEVISGVHFDGNLVALLGVAVVFGVINWLIKPVLSLLTLPLTILSLGLFALVLNALLLLLTSALVPAYGVDGFWTALIAAILISIISTVLNWFIP